MALKESDTERLEQVIQRAEAWAASPEASEEIKASQARAEQMSTELAKAREINPQSLHRPTDC